LIEKIRELPIIWNCALPQYKDDVRRLAAFLTIQMQLKAEFGFELTGEVGGCSSDFFFLLVTTLLFFSPRRLKRRDGLWFLICVCA
jgi:hypothetical protein